jgi:CheY-like chemotaxis protein
MGEARARTVLVVEDGNAFSRLIRRALEHRRFAVYCAKSPDQGLSQFLEHRLEMDLVVIDMVTPVAGNFDLAADLERLQPGLPILYLVGSQPSIARASLEAQSPGSVLVTPFTEEQLIARVNGLLELDVAVGESADRQLWNRLLETSDELESGSCILYVYESRESALAAAHAAMLCAGNISFAFRPTNNEACPYGVMAPARDAVKARSLIAGVSPDKRLTSAA